MVRSIKMLDFLKDKGINQWVIDDIININYDAMIYNLQMNEMEICKIIDYFREIGITVVDEILINASGVFLNNLKYVKLQFEKENIVELVKEINYNYMYILEIL